ncbi:(2Fe-2S)-binding protein [Tunturibacter empetritectus]|uniref:Xanthine dehydrogenase YagT iron-sulfur-binding subunit n=1 Tax=Tunturiibacter empetritectus TaxID=3069691 RepID=A0A7W8IJQ2_9BACT|nr:2Fe-2S iron-sulfur cluster-binding protein [Edaphobacter lichenicola]MBB5318407.1 xanthine dehydrogenase YagT iron-sulfur-binding subunit [Edaphobacter lichenicola]
MSGISHTDSPPRVSSASNSVKITLTINGPRYALIIDTRTTLLDLLRERLDLSGTQKGCDHGLCGACTVSVDEERVVSCHTLAASVSESKVLTVEGLSEGDDLSDLQQAFLEHDAFQCGYCTPGQISSAHAMLREHARGDLSMVSYEGTRGEVVNGRMELSEHEIRERMAGNICRCGAYANIVAAVRAVSQRGQL